MTWSDQIAGELKLRLQAIRVAAGFNTDAGQDVILGWRNMDDDHPTPNLTLLETGQNLLSDAIKGANVRIQIQWAVEGMVSTDGVNALADLYAIDADVLRALFLNPLEIDGRYIRMAYGGRELAGPEEGGRLALVRVNFTTEHSEQLL